MTHSNEDHFNKAQVKRKTARKSKVDSNKKAPDFLKAEFLNIPSAEEEILTDRLFQAGALGVSQKIKFEQKNMEYEPRILTEDKVTLEAFFNPEDWLKASEEFLSQYKTVLSEEHNRDWLEEWKKHFKPFEVYNETWIYPSWYKENTETDKINKKIWIEPGMAFGTGTHATTKLCIEALGKALESSDPLKFKTALDMGSGSSVLSIFLKQKGVKEVTPCEIDALARENGDINLNLNNITDTKVIAPEDLDQNQKFDLVVANIIDGILLKLKDLLLSHNPEVLILSGILIENQNNIIKNFTQGTGYGLVEQKHLEEWVCLTFKRES